MNCPAAVQRDSSSKPDRHQIMIQVRAMKPSPEKNNERMRRDI